MALAPVCLAPSPMNGYSQRRVGSNFSNLWNRILVDRLVGAWLLKPPPDGYVPEGWDPSQLKPAVTTVMRDLTPSEMLADRSFYLLFAAYCFGAMAGLGLISQLVPFGREAGITNVALIGLIVGAVGNTTGRVVSGSSQTDLAA
ncbi:MAG: hypothetical protein Ct9H300mP25_07120 [Acidobacteriota bacterium]|nr:MAG: hypothetical protein Ct9H300mP25_07120 [Acidobacteriota bacterium]